MKIDSLRLIALLALVTGGVSYFAQEPHAQGNRRAENHAIIRSTVDRLAAAPKVVKSGAETP